MRWLRNDPRHWALDTESSTLRIDTYHRTIRDIWPNNQSNLLQRQAPQGDYSLSAGVALAPDTDFQQATVLVCHNGDNYLLVARGYCSTCVDNGQSVSLETERSGAHQIVASVPWDERETELRVERLANTYAASYLSADGGCTLQGEVDRPELADAWIGISAASATINPTVPIIPAEFQFFTVEVPGDYPQPAAEPEMASEAVPVIVDDAGSPDGVIALLYFLRHPDHEVKAITVSNGEAHTELFAQNPQRMLDHLGRTGIPVAAGSP